MVSFFSLFQTNKGLVELYKKHKKYQGEGPTVLCVWCFPLIPRNTTSFTVQHEGKEHPDLVPLHCWPKGLSKFRGVGK